jgi:hypothetical protein
MIEVLHPDTQLLLTTSEIEAPAYVEEIYGKDSSLLPDGKNRAIGYMRDVGKGGVAYFALGHCHSPTTNVQVTVASNIADDNVVPLQFKGMWDTEHYQQLLRNAIEWGTVAAA